MTYTIWLFPLISGYYFLSNFTEHHKSTKYKYNTKSLIEIVKQINDFLKDNKTTYLNI